MRTYFTSLTFLLLALALTLDGTGCSKRDNDTPGSESPTEEPALPSTNPQTDLGSTVYGHPVVFDTAVAFTRGSSAIHLAFSDEPRTCDQVFELLGALEAGGAAADELVFWVDIVRPLPRRDHAGYVPGWTRLGDDSSERTSGEVEVGEVDTSRGGHTSGRIDIAVHGVGFDGSFDAIGCGEYPSPRVAARTQNLLVLFDRQQFVIEGATVQWDGNNPRLVLTTSPHDCDQVAESDVQIELSLGGVAGDQVDVLSAAVSGVRMRRSVAISPSDGALFAVTAVGPQTSSEAVFQIDRSLSVIGAQLALEGTVFATHCH